jgi:alkanesulfonate monooxygenase SsuD/methylene tetrahydromethanopterin reductase-like flavin-dependent oxidoreductase (luciferase family)
MEVAGNSPTTASPASVAPVHTMPAPLGRWPASKRQMGIGMIMPISDRSAFLGTPRFRDMLEMAQTAERIGMDGVWIPDHFLVEEQGGKVIRGVWEGWTVLAGIAAATSTITLGIYVTCTAFRSPEIIAKMAETLDEISQGRFVLGLGAGWNKPEFDRFGFPFDHRGSRFADAIKIISPMLREGTATYDGTYYQAHDAINLPRGPRGNEGGPPILVGTAGPRLMRLTAQYADAWNSDWQHDPSTLRPLLRQLDEACAAVGRDPETLVRTSASNVIMGEKTSGRPNPMTGTPEQIADQIRAFRDLGLRHWVAGLDPCTPRTIEQFGRIIELLDEA